MPRKPPPSKAANPKASSKAAGKRKATKADVTASVGEDCSNCFYACAVPFRYICLQNDVPSRCI
eukprot:4735896-Amphidinium_carterae.1